MANAPLVFQFVLYAGIYGILFFLIIGIIGDWKRRKNQSVKVVNVEVISYDEAVKEHRARRRGMVQYLQYGLLIANVPAAYVSLKLGLHSAVVVTCTVVTMMYVLGWMLNTFIRAARGSVD